ncbi:MAG TPA: tRNA dihydrouridine synthase DusB [Planctomycetes bacterium]|nr:tRNA dihydrouridine synthase DusB [Planctomycetota bacterium]
MTAGFRIAHLSIASPLVMAPMAGYTTSAFRLLAKEAGCGLVFSETISTKGIFHRNERSWVLMAFQPAERPIGIQLLGSDPDIVAHAVARAEELAPDLIDINLGCPTPKVTSKCEGGALLADPARACAIVRAACATAHVPVTAKLRLPGEFVLPEFIDFLRALQDCGVSALTLHPRTVEERFRGRARWEVFPELAPRLSVPLIASGDAKNAQDVRTLLGMGCAAVMIGRAAIGNPHLFKEILADLEGRPAAPQMPAERLALCLRHLAMLAAESGERTAVRHIRKQLVAYLRPVPGHKRLVPELIAIDAYADLAAAIEAIRRNLA